MEAYGSRLYRQRTAAGVGVVQWTYEPSRCRCAVLAGVLAIAAGCDPTDVAHGTDAESHSDPTPAPAAQFATAGDPESDGGATWTLRGPVDGTVVDLRGVLMKPAGSGPFPPS